jgi:CheY-like chemotaxis protein
MPLGSETLLIVDDDAAIRRVIYDTLEPLGYSLLEAGSGEDALALLDRTKDKIDLVLTDLIMPGINGQELIKTLQKEQPEIKFILMSGYTDDIVADRGVFEQGVEFINKPLLPMSLTNKIREVLDTKQA